ncbi:probable sodium/potassium/calcium exchanger CG1090 isoform X2 [Penaeus monodon]|uniref:probable sodium/potassium/calcium exchanger CG1090 isoform X2 n=1 Tax=Penaeus monodon TaxID=6687 RepID=UPI0018A7073B|nr:probable sodium/potassium/calcium exchanger CG1090 isoform X2 [Penaeus monodon]
MGLAARLGIRTRQARLRPLLLAFVTYLGLVTLLTHGHTLLHQPLTAPSEDVSEAMSLSSSSSSRHLLQTDVWGGENCTQPAIEQFPRPLMSSAARKSGGLILHILISFYMFLGIAIVCDEYFVPSLEMICDCLQMSEDVAGATFMAAGSSAPELATSVIAVFVAKDDIGISGVIGSAVFNIMFVISVCALFAGQVIVINWWPLIRDSTFYCISICGLLITIYNEKVNWYESVFLLLLYVLYIVMMFYNKRLETWANTLNIPFKNATREEKSSLFGTKPVPPVGEDMKAESGQDSENPAMDGQETFSHPHTRSYGSIAVSDVPKEVEATEVESAGVKSMAPEMKDEDVSPWTMPVGVGERASWLVKLPLVALHHFTTPDCRRERFRRWYLVTFIMSMLWIAAYSYIMVWMITVIGFTLGIPDTVMGLTFIAVGVSVPDALSSLCVAKQGFGDMAVSNAIGSNVFDILLCLGLPWFLKTAIVDPGSIVPVESRGLTYSTVSLFSTVVFLIVATHMNGWKLDKKYGIVLMFWYLIFMVFASLYELNVFGYFNPPECESSY